jgi:hypothetical protein
MMFFFISCASEILSKTFYCWIVLPSWFVGPKAQFFFFIPIISFSIWCIYLSIKLNNAKIPTTTKFIYILFKSTQGPGIQKYPAAWYIGSVLCVIISLLTGLASQKKKELETLRWVSNQKYDFYTKVWTVADRSQLKIDMYTRNRSKLQRQATATIHRSRMFPVAGVVTGRIGGTS